MRQSVAERVRARLVAEVDPHEAVHADLVAGLVREEAPLLDTSRAGLPVGASIEIATTGAFVYDAPAP